MSKGTIKLVVTTAHLTRSLMLRRFVGSAYPRTEISSPTVSYSLYQVPFLSGQSGRLPHLWSMTVNLLPAEWAILKQMHVLSQQVRSRPAVFVHDYTEPFTEPSQTRALAEGAALIQQDGMVSYYAQFAAFFSPPPAVEANGIYRKVTVTLQELDRLPP